jgi:hypothetical protein
MLLREERRGPRPQAGRHRPRPAETSYEGSRAGPSGGGGSTIESIPIPLLAAWNR